MIVAGHNARVDVVLLGHADGVSRQAALCAAMATGGL